MRRMVRGLLMLALFGALGGASAQSYPDRPVHLVVAFVPGGATDTMARQILGELSVALGQPVVVENRPGANGYLGWNYVANAAPDGYTLLLAENALAMSQALYRKAASGFDPLKQYDAIATVASSPMVLVVANGVKANNVQELVALSKAGAQKMNYASAGIGSVTHLVMEVFRDGVGMDAVHVPYKGGGQAVADVMADAKVRERLARLDITPDYAPGPVLLAKLANEIRNWTAFVDAKNIKPE